VSAPEARINAYRAAVVATIRASMPELRQAEEQFGRFDLSELERTMLPAPAVRVAIIKARARNQPPAAIEADLSCAAFVITDGRDRDRHGWAIAEGIVTILHSGQLFGLTRLGAPSNVEIQPLVSLQLRQRGASIMAVEWRQELRQLGEGIFDDEKHLLKELYVNDELWPLTEAGNG